MLPEMKGSGEYEQGWTWVRGQTEGRPEFIFSLDRFVREGFNERAL
jgi:hypothetical protein